MSEQGGSGQPGFGQAGFGQVGSGQAGSGQASLGQVGPGAAQRAADPGQSDPGERLAAALRRIAIAIERREASLERPPVNPAAIPAVARDLDGLIARLRAVLDEMSGGGGARE